MKKIFAVVMVFLAAAAIFAAFNVKAIGAEGAASSGDADVSAKLDQILDGQREIKAALSSLKEELNIVKIRVTSKM
jgi:hypothetical protein